MCIFILRVAVVKILSVASSLHACRERVGGGDRGVWGENPHVGGGPRTVTDWLSWQSACPR